MVVTVFAHEIVSHLSLPKSRSPPTPRVDRPDRPPRREYHFRRRQPDGRSPGRLEDRHLHL